MKGLARKVQMRRRHSNAFRMADLTESVEELANPGRGWYHIYTLNAQPPEQKVPLDQEIWFYGNAPQEKLALALIDLSAFRSGPIIDSGLGRINDVLSFFRTVGKQVILRFTYDTRGVCFCREPSNLATVTKHMKQIGPIVAQHSDNVLAAQGLFIGNWGEMHGSRFSDETSLHVLARTFYKSTDGLCFLALRTPALFRTLANCAGDPPGLRDKLALFNDAMFGSQTDLGTYGQVSREGAGENGKWTRTEELIWQQQSLAHVPNGGEAVGSDTPVGFLEASGEMGMMHVSYLNSIYSEAQLGHWKQEAVNKPGNRWHGLSGFDYIGRRLGYRFVVRDAFIGQKKELFVSIENCGFANLCQSADCFLTVEGPGGRSSSTKLAADPRTWGTAEKVTIPTGFRLAPRQDGPLSLFLSLRLANDGTPIVFANEGAGERLKIGELPDSKRSKRNAARLSG